MNLFVISLVQLLMLSAHAQSKAKVEVNPGIILCSITQPSTLGFQLIRVGSKDRVYKGSFDIDSYKFEGEYLSKTGDLDLKISVMDDDYVVTEDIFFLKANLYSSQFLHFRLKQDTKPVEIYCYFIAQT